MAVLPTQAMAQATTIVITGSRIPQANLVTTSPVTTVGQQDVNTQGVTRVEDLTNQLPQVFAAQNASISNGSNATATVDLRGLGSRRTLVLVDGKRMPYGSPTTSPAADLNQIPAQLISRVEILTGGASAIYGSDALAGVVNFIMNTDYEGLRLDAQYATYQHTQDDDLQGNLAETIRIRGLTNPSQFHLPPRDVTDGASREITVIAGSAVAEGRGHVQGYFTWRRNDPVLAANRNFSACTIGGQNKAGKNGGGQAVGGFPVNTEYTCGGSATSYPGYFYFAGPGSPATVDSITGNTFRAFNANLDLYNFGPLNFIQRPDERFSFGAFGNYEISAGAEFYAQLMFTDYQTNAQIAPSGNFFNTNSINCDNPLMSVSQHDDICGVGNFVGTAPLYIARRNVEGGGRQDHRELWSYRTVAGVRGTAWEGFDYDVSAQRSKTTLEQIYRNDFSVTRIARAIDVVNWGPDGIAGNADDAPICRSVVNGTDPNCVPWNIFTLAGFTGGSDGAGGPPTVAIPGGPSAAALAYLQVPLLQTASEVQTIVNAAITGDLGRWGLQSPWAKDGIKGAIGGEVRRDEVHDTVDNNFATGDGAGQGGPTLATEGSTDVWELFGELQVPLFQNMPWIKQITVDAAYRYSSYDNNNHTHTYKFGADYAPNDDFRVRGSYQRAVRAPNVLELFAPQGIGLFNSAAPDPCGLGGAATVAQCVGGNSWQVTAGQFGAAALNNPAKQYNGLFGGNPGLHPEVGRTWTFGAVFTPTFAPGLTASVDWFNIRVGQAIGVLGGVNVLTGCYTLNILAQCALINRDAGGTIWRGPTGYIQLTNLNTGGIKTTGVDVNVQYAMDLADMGIGNWGSLTAGLVGTWLDELVADTGSGQPAFDCAGFWGNAGAGVGHEDCGTPNFEWRHRFRVTWESPWHFDISGTWRYYSSVDRHGADTTAINGVVGGFIERSFDAYNYFDLAANVHILKGTTLRLGVNNVADTDPPLTGTYQPAGIVNGNTFPQVYDPFGRYVFGGITIDM